MTLAAATENAVLDLAFDAVIVRGLEDDVIHGWNRAAAEAYGWSRADALGRTAAGLLKRRFPAAGGEAERSLAEAGSWEGDVELERRDGRRLLRRCRWRRVAAADGRELVVEVHSLAPAPHGTEPVGEDMFRLLVESVKDYAIFLLDPHGVVTTWNEGAERIKGFRASDIIGKHFSTFYRREDLEAGRPDWELVAAAREGRFEDEGWRVRHDGSMFWANVVITALRDSRGVLRGFAKVTRDMTARREAEQRRLEVERDKAEQARAHAERMAQLEKVKGEFLNLASHELRGPLSVVAGYLSMFEDGSLEPERLSPLLPTLTGKVREIEGIVSQMLETARLEDGRLELSVKLVDLRDVARSAIATKRGLLLPDHRLEIEVGDSPVLVLGDRQRLDTIAANLLDNAIKYSPDGGLITVTVLGGTSRAFLSVGDEGIGMAPEEVAGLFQRFARYVPVAYSNISGTGLGLYLARELARRQGGDIIVESRLGVGSRFTLALPNASRA